MRYPCRMVLLLLLACSETSLTPKPGDPGGLDSGGAPDIRVAPAAVDFGDVLPGASATAALTIENVGDASLGLATLSLAGGSAEVTWTALGSTLLGAGERTETVLTWAPVGAGGLDDALEIPSDDSDEPLVRVPLTGRVPVGDLVVEPELHDFGDVEVGAAETVVLRVSNVGAGPIVVADWTYTSGDGDLRVLDAGALAALPATLAPGASTEVLVEYAPSADGPDEGTLAVESDDPDAPTTWANQLGNGLAPDPCEGFTQTVTLMLTADDAWQGWIDGTPFSAPNQNAWNASDTVEWELACGDHTLALYATDTARAVSGVIAVIWVEGVVRFVSGPTHWSMVDVAPPAGWTDVGFDDSAWNIPQVCADTSLWGSYPQPFYDQGAQWIWWTTQCRDLGEAWLRLDFTVP